jgi:hypothetical protein
MTSNDRCNASHKSSSASMVASTVAKGAIADAKRRNSASTICCLVWK